MTEITGVPEPTVPVEDQALPPPVVPDRPVPEADRIRSLDVLRGVSVLGIFLVNLQTFDLPSPAFMNPNLAGFDQGLDRVAYTLVYLLALTKTMPIFSMLFGAGVVLFTSRVEAREGRSGRRWFSRQAWLWIIGLLHGYLLWNGDILVPYAVVGLTLYKARRWRPRTLVILAVICLLIPKAGMWGMGKGMEYVRVRALEIEQLEADGQELTPQQVQMREAWFGTSRAWDPGPERMTELRETMRGGYLGILKHNGAELAQQHFAMYPLIVNWSIAGYMLLGMALLKAGVLQAARSTRFYVVMLAICYGVGLPGSVLAMRYMGAHFTDILAMLGGGMQLHETTGAIVALGHIALVMLIVRGGCCAALLRPLAAAGRMAFTNYLSQSVIGATLFYGWGFGLWGGVSRVGLLGIAAAVWALQLAWSPWWLARFRFGPAEWLWRSLTYRKRQPMRRAAEA